MTENLIKAICWTNVNWSQAVKMINRVAQLGPTFPHFRNLNAWPTPREILRAGEPYLQQVARLGYRTDTILQLCRQTVAGKVDYDRLDAYAKTESVDQLRARLLAIKGVGPATAAFLLTLLGHFEYLSIDSATVAHAARTYFNGRKPTHAQIEKVYAKYGPWKHLVYWFEQWIESETAQGMM